ncbi:hydroxymethylglutaryl-CoA synthase [Parendozoicomonas sp. Alg238-R29]|uniref:hydroxymethylglutaryl-CoA synthase n=1 Tax=Parendozoicomonas sp. Alg238-R29 TaxID=2993446 RepID=UPI00248D9502|nr:hydroxymethylglutaryl-CoA synthase [Parendozoicomonas sp. Alg238-R29]
MSVGIDDISFYSSGMFLPLATLAEHNGEDPDKYRIGLGQERMGVPAQDEDIVTLAANAARPLINSDNRENITTVLFATESSIDQSKAAGVYVQRLLGLGSNCRIVELKQACYSATAALQMACGLVARKPESQVLVLASDIARYGFDTPGEATQGCGAIAFIVKANPRLLAVHAETGCYSEDVMDFWRPNYMDTALVDGKYSTIIYLKALRQSWKNYHEAGGLDFGDFSRFCYHLPFTKMGEKAHRKLAVTNGVSMDVELLEKQIGSGLLYNRQIGNSYSASLYIGLLSLLENDQEDLSGQNVGLFSYGSGCVGEFFSVTVQPGYKQYSRRVQHVDMLETRQELDYEGYASLFSHTCPKDGGEHYFPSEAAGHYRLAGIHDHKRIYTETGD